MTGVARAWLLLAIGIFLGSILERHEVIDASFIASVSAKGTNGDHNGDRGGRRGKDRGSRSHEGDDSRDRHRRRDSDGKSEERHAIRRRESPMTAQPRDSSSEPDQVLALNLTSEQLAVAGRLGVIAENAESFANLGITMQVLRVPSGRERTTVLQELSLHLPAQVLDLNTRYALAEESCRNVKCYAHTLIGWRESARNQCGRALRIGMIDSPIELSTPALREVDIVTRAFIGDRYAAPSAHGTALAALLVGRRSEAFAGLLPQSKLIAANAFYMTRDGEVTTNIRLLIKALDWLLERDVDVINLSLAGPPNRLLQVAMQRATEEGVVVVAAAGNGGSYAPAAYPAAYPEVIAATALDRYYRPYHRANRGDYVSFAAPGVDIWTPTGGGNGTYHSGTSFASAFVSAVAADAIAQGLTAAKVVPYLRSRSRDLGAAGADPVFGWGLVRSNSDCAFRVTSR